MTYGDALMAMFDKALDRKCDIYITVDENHNMFSLNIQPHIEMFDDDDNVGFLKEPED